jgi:hypothetical protein
VITLNAAKKTMIDIIHKMPDEKAAQLLEYFQDYLHNRYIDGKLAEAEAIENDPDKRLSAEEVFKNWDDWSAGRK